MDTLPLDLSQPPTQASLQAFLEGCRERARERDHPQLISISVESDLLDPLAVLESIYESDQPHFYVERRSEGVALAGAEIATCSYPHGKGRFQDAGSFIERTLENAIAIGDQSLPFFGPHFFCGFTFFDEVKENEPFPPATVFTPCWQVSVKEGRCVATANALVDQDSDVSSIALRIWKANEKFKSFDYSSTSPVSSEKHRDDWRFENVSEPSGTERFEAALNKALGEIRSGALNKIVLARAQDLKANQAFHPLQMLNALRDRFPDCYAFSFANGKGQSFIGASPERLVKVEQGEIETDALAGSAPRGLSAAEDARLGSALLRSEKDRREHRVVLESIRRRLEAMGVEPESPSQPKLKRLSNVQHLYNELHGRLPPELDLLKCVENLHPSPAVGGSPRDEACHRIPALETFDRGLYAGPIGWVNSHKEGEFFVSIRSALVEGDFARLYAGVGIVEGSIPDKEIQETNLKFRALLENLL